MHGPEDWKRLDALLDAALDVPEAQRDAWLEEQCPSDPDLRARLRVLLGAMARSPVEPGGAMTGPVWSAVADELAQGLDAFAPGARLGDYEIVAELGAGGMGHVYRARHTSLGREVAIKALAPSLAGDAARLRRFEREARLLAGLNHPNIAVLHEVLELDAARYLVLELVDGETLGEALARGALPLAEAVAVAQEIAEALEEAHRSGIVHRDLKPSNVMRSRAGRVKVLDFGLAKSVEPPDEKGLTRSAGASTTTETGMILGTAPYMSPEQARGEDVDERADVWAFGCLVYEMLTGHRAFEGRTSSDVLASVLRDAPDFSRLPAATPPALSRLLERCLRKDRRLRLQAIGDARLELSELGADAAPPRGPRGGRLAWLAAAGGIGLAAGAGLAVAVWPRAALAPVAARLVVEPGPGVSLAPDYAPPFALAPDGATLVFIGSDGAGRTRLFVRPLDRLEARPLPGTEGAWQPFFSPDGRHVGFFADRHLKKIALDGGGPLALAEVGGNPRGASWARDGSIVLAPETFSGLVRVPEQGGPLEPLTYLDDAADERSHRWPQVLPDGSGVLFTVQTGGDDFDDASVHLVSLASGARRRVLAGASFGRVAPGSPLLYARGGRLYATDFDPASDRAPGPGRVVIDGIDYDARNGGTQIDLARNGTLAYVPGRPHPVIWHLVWVDRAGRRERLRGDPRPFHDRRVSPDGQHVAICVGSAAAADLWLLEVASGTLTQLSFGLAPLRPVWRPDGRSITVASGSGGRFRLSNVAVDRSAPPHVLYEGPHSLYPNDWSPDGRRLVFQERRPGTGWGLHVLDFDAAGAAQGPPLPLVDTEHDEAMARVSRDGRFVAYESNELDKVFDVYVRPFDGPGPPTRVSTDAGRFPVWGPPGELFYWRSFRDRIRIARYRVEANRFVALGDDYAFPEAVRAERGMRAPHFGFDVEPSSGRFLMQEPVSEEPEPPRRLVVALGWLQGLPGRAGLAR